MEFLTQINDYLTNELGEFGPLIVVGALGLFMILLTIPMMLNQPEDPLKKLKRNQNPDVKPKSKKDRLRQGGRNEQLEKFATFLEPQNADEMTAVQLRLRQAGYQSKDSVRFFHFAQFALGIVGLILGLIYVFVLGGGEDLGTQDSCMFDPETIYANYLKPRHRRMVQTVKALTNDQAKVCFHCCGSAYHFIPHLIEIGVDALNPVQVTAKNMEPERLKADFGDKICFWGGINTQHILPFGTPEEVAAETRRIISILGAGGGYILNSVHNIQAEVPPENIVAMFETGVQHRYH